jgi:YegS/Rv2252/BmrU family lipid kinase
MGHAAVIVHNPTSGRRRHRYAALSAMVNALGERGISAEIRATSAPGDATRLARDAVTGGSPTIVVHGGDGTVNEAMQAIVGSPAALAVWPGGTANVLARELGLPNDIEGVAEMIAAGRVRRVGVGRAGARYFLSMAGVGVDAALVRAVNPTLKHLLGEGAYWVAALGQLARWRPERFLVEVAGREYGATFAVIARVASYGGGLRIAPRARIESDQFDLCLFDWASRHRFLRGLPAAYSGRHLDLPGVTYLRAAGASARGEGLAWVQVDGELLGPLPMTFEYVPAALSLLMP